MKHLNLTSLWFRRQVGHSDYLWRKMCFKAFPFDAMVMTERNMKASDVSTQIDTFGIAVPIVEECRNCRGWQHSNARSCTDSQENAMEETIRGRIARLARLVTQNLGW